MNKISAFAGGLAGACSLTLLHEIARRVDSDAPRMDLLGMEAASKGLSAVHLKTPSKDKLFTWTMIGDMIGNAMYYSAAAVGDKKQVWQKGALLGLSAGLGAVYLPKPLGLDEKPATRTSKTKAMTIGLYLIGGLVAAATINLLNKKS